MKMRTRKDSGASFGLIGRRLVLKVAVTGVGLAVLPGVRVLAAAASNALAPTVAMGYWNHQAATVLNTSDDIVDARSVVPAPATYELRVLATNTQVPLAIDAQYLGDAEHRFWQAWIEQGMLQHSPRSGIRWWAQGNKALPLVVWLGGAGYTQVTARAGTYVMAIGPNGQHLPAWKDLAVRVKSPRDTDSQLVLRSSSEPVMFPYLMFSVQPILAL